MHNLLLRKSVEKTFFKLAKKNPKLLMKIKKKIDEIIHHPEHYKNLRQPLNHLKRVHIEKRFVLVFSVDSSAKQVIIEDFDHHDKIYSK